MGTVVPVSQRAASPRPHLCSPPAAAHLSMMPFMRMALFQSFSVDLPARCTNSFGLMTCWSYCREHSGGSGRSRPRPLRP